MTTRDDEDPRGEVLAEVRDMGPVTAGAIARATGLSESTVRRHLIELETSQLVESDRYQRRARVYLATPTMPESE
jgi:predicted ArsR family transcriptional regulator